MLKGFMDHWVPTRDRVSTFWKQDLSTALRQLDELKRDVDYNHFTFYTKWITNGIRSSLPYLYNHPDASNVRTDNKWGNEIIAHLHAKGVSVGAMLQLVIYEQPYWEEEMSAGEWNLGTGETSLPVRVADFTHPDYPMRLCEIVKEQLALFPGLDYLFLEFEGVDHGGDIRKLYEPWSAAHRKPSIDEVHYDDRTIEYCKRMDIPLQPMWSVEGREMLKYYYGRNIDAVDACLREIGFRGTVGAVFHLYEYEAFIYPDMLADKKHWWLLPWHYWTFRPAEAAILDERKRAGIKLLKDWKEAGHSVCYIGDVTMGAVNEDREALVRYCEICRELQLAGYLGMGNPDPELGLRWDPVSDRDCADARALYAQLYRDS